MATINELLIQRLSSFSVVFSAVLFQSSQKTLFPQGCALRLGKSTSLMGLIEIIDSTRELLTAFC